MSKGVQGNFAAQVRVFAHDAVSVTPSATKISNTDQRGVCLYIGGQGDVKVIMESGTTQTFKNVSAGILALYQNMWLGIGYTIPQRGDKNLHIPVEGGFIISETGDLVMLTEDGNNEMVTEPTP